MVMRGQDMREPPAFGLQSRRDRLGVGHVDGRSGATGIVDQHAVVVGKARKLVNLEFGHLPEPRRFACIFVV
jgi:hypothetical protein